MAPLTKPLAPSLTLLRTFSTSLRYSARQSDFKPVTSSTALPPYPYGPSMFYKQSNLGLYGLQKIRYGNMVSEKNEIKTRRHWRPNVHHKRLWSGYLKKMIRIRVTTRVLRTIDKVGGLDEYLLGEKTGRIKELGVGGWAMRWRIMQTDGAKERFRLERQSMGLAPKEEPVVGLDGTIMGEAQQLEEMRAFDAALAKEDTVMVMEDELAAETAELSPEEIKFMDEEASSLKQSSR